MTTQFIVTQSAKEYSDYQKRKAKKLRDSLFLAYGLMVVAGCGVWQLLKGMVYH